MLRTFFVLIILLTGIISHAQKNDIIFGLHVEPIFPNRMFRIQTQEVIKNNTRFSIIPKTGYLFGSHLSYFISNSISVETGINLLQRNYKMQAEDKSNTVALDYTIHNFEIPLTATFYVQLFEQIFMSHTAGISMQMLPSHIISSTSWVDNYGVISEFQQLSLRRNWLIPSFKGSLGFEFRSIENGFFYIGSVYHLFARMYNTEITYITSNTFENFNIKTDSDFFGILFRYSFPPSELNFGNKRK